MDGLLNREESEVVSWVEETQPVLDVAQWTETRSNLTPGSIQPALDQRLPSVHVTGDHGTNVLGSSQQEKTLFVIVATFLLPLATIPGGKGDS